MPATTPRRGRGAARSERARRDILAAATALIAEEGYERLTIEAIASRAGVGRPTIYRWWPSKSAIIAECLADDALRQGDFVPPDTGDVEADVVSWFTDVARFVSTPEHIALIRALIAAAMDSPELASSLIRRIGARPEALEQRLRSALDTGELAPDSPIAEWVELITGSIALRILDRSGIGERDAPGLVHAVLGGRVRPRAQKRSP